jgi:hypothetical protein
METNCGGLMWGIQKLKICNGCWLGQFTDTLISHLIIHVCVLTLYKV